MTGDPAVSSAGFSESFLTIGIRVRNPTMPGNMKVSLESIKCGPNSNMNKDSFDLRKNMERCFFSVWDGECAGLYHGSDLHCCLPHRLSHLGHDENRFLTELFCNLGYSLYLFAPRLSASLSTPKQQKSKPQISKLSLLSPGPSQLLLLRAAARLFSALPGQMLCRPSFHMWSPGPGRAVPDSGQTSSAFTATPNPS